MHKNIHYSIHSSKKHRQYESNKKSQKYCLLQNTRSVQKMESLPMRNASYYLYLSIGLRFCFNNNKNTTLKSTKTYKN